MNKIIFAILALTLFLGLTACKEGGSSRKESPTPDTDSSSATLHSSNESPEVNSDTSSEYGRENLDDWLTIYQPAFEDIEAEYSDIEQLSYYIFDLNDDGVKEIFIKGVFPYDTYKWLYALDGGEPVKIGEYWSRNDYTDIYSGGYIYGSGSNGASDDVDYIEQMVPGSNALIAIVNVSYHWDEDGSVQVMLNGSEVKQAEAEAALNAYDNMRGEEIVPEWTLYRQ